MMEKRNKAVTSPERFQLATYFASDTFPPSFLPSSSSTDHRRPYRPDLLTASMGRSIDGDDLLAAALRAHRATIKRDLPAFTGRFDSNRAIKALHYRS